MDMNIGQAIAFILLVGRLWSSWYLIRVVRVQQDLLKRPAVDEYGAVDADVMHFRRNLSLMTLVILLGQVIPVAIDLVNVFEGSSPRWLGFLYAISNVITAVTASALIFKLYELATNTKEVNDLERTHMQNKHDKEMSNKR